LRLALRTVFICPSIACRLCAMLFLTCTAGCIAS
jgi:hypothetical protein